MQRLISYSMLRSMCEGVFGVLFWKWVFGHRSFLRGAVGFVLVSGRLSGMLWFVSRQAWSS